MLVRIAPAGHRWKWLWVLPLLLWTACKGQQPEATSSSSGAPTSSSQALPPAQPAQPPQPARAYAQKVWILGFDGVDPNWLKTWADAGKLPNVKKLMDGGGFYPLRSTNPPQSPVAWSSFATGNNPGAHGVFDFLKRDPSTYFPAVGAGDIQGARFGAQGEVVQPARGISERTGPSFWKVASDQGVVSTALNVPFAFPPEEMPHGVMFSGLGTPDLRGTNSTFTYFSSNLADDVLKKGVPGGRLVRLLEQGGALTGSFDGPNGPDGSGRASATVSFQVDKARQQVLIRLQEQREAVALGKWSGWFDYTFQVTPRSSVRALGRFFVISLEPLEVFMYPPNMHPDEPWIPFTAPTPYSAELKQKLGPFKTVGWTHDTNALNSEKLDDKPWLEDVFFAMDALAELGLREARERPASLFIWVETATDRVAHMMTRSTDTKSPRFDKELVGRLGGDPILLTYQRMDDILGRFIKQMPPETTLLVISDHGFHTYHRGLNTNAWLLENGYLALLPGKVPGPETNLFNSVDWSRTRAYSLGTGQIYINLAGREGQGIVKADDYAALVDEISARLVTLKDPSRGDKPLSRVYKRDEIYRGARLNDAPDLQVAFAEGWRTSWETMLGGIPAGLFSDNLKKWSGDHAASDVEDTSGVLLTNQRLSVENPAIIDIAPTVLSIFGVERPQWEEGRDLYAGRLTRPPLVEGSSPASPP